MNLKTCSQCGKSLPKDAPNGNCPNCLLGLAMNNPVAQETSAHLSDLEFNAPRADQLVGKFPNLEIVQLLGHGGMGAVYEARQTNLDRRVALKILSPKLNSDPTFAERFTREAKTLAKLSHPNIVMVFDFGAADGMHYLVMEYVDGVNLRDAIETQKLLPKEALEVIPQVCDALQYAHDQGVIHRDIKPENILLDKRGQVKIADFGLAKLQSPNNLTLTGTRQILGTASYMAPEQIEKPTSVDHRVDIYSLGVVFYELLTGELPIGRFSAPSEKVSVSTNLDEVVLKTLEKDPGRRFQQASHVRTAVETADIELVREAPAAGNMPNGNAGDASHNRGAESANSTHLNNGLGRAETIALPFKLSNVHGGFAEAAGIVRGYAKGLKFEFEVTDAIGLTKSGPKHAFIPYENIVSVRRKDGLFGILGDKLIFQGDSIESVNPIPTSSQGKFTINCKASERDLCNKFLDDLRFFIPNTCTPTAPVKTENDFSDEGQVVVEERLSVPRTGLMIAAVLHLLIALGIGLMFTPMLAEARHELAEFQARSTRFIDGAQKISIDWEVYVIFQVGLSVYAVASIFAAFFCWLCSSNLGRFKNYFATLTLLIVTAIPFSPAALFALPSAIWGLIVMTQSQTRFLFRQHAINRFRERATQVSDSKSFDTEMSKDMLSRTLRAAMLFVFLFLCVASVGAIMVWGVTKQESKRLERQNSTEIRTLDEALQAMENAVNGEVSKTADGIEMMINGESVKVKTGNGQTTATVDSKASSANSKSDDDDNDEK